MQSKAKTEETEETNWVSAKTEYLDTDSLTSRRIVKPISGQF